MVLCTWAIYFTSLCLSLLIYKMLRMILLLPSCSDCYKDSVRDSLSVTQNCIWHVKAVSTLNTCLLGEHLLYTWGNSFRKPRPQGAMCAVV